MKIEPAPEFAPTFNEPQPDWVPIERALFYFNSPQFSTSEEECAGALIAALKDATDEALKDEAPYILANAYTILRDGSRVELKTKKVSTEISPLNGHVSVVSNDFFEQDGWGFTVRGAHRLKELFEGGDWNKEVSADDVREALIHRHVLLRLYDRWQNNFLTAMTSGTARIMARRSVLSPFQVIAWDQWQFFELKTQEYSWALDPRLRPPATARAPSGEKLFSIYVAPGNRIREESEPDEEGKCQQWLVQMMQGFPDRPPRPLGQLCEQAISQFAGLSKRGFERCYLLAKEQSQNTSWSRPGAPKKSPQKSLQKK